VFINENLARQLGSSPSDDFAARIVRLMNPSIFWLIKVFILIP